MHGPILSCVFLDNKTKYKHTHTRPKTRRKQNNKEKSPRTPEKTALLPPNLELANRKRKF